MSAADDLPRCLSSNGSIAPPKYERADTSTDEDKQQEAPDEVRLSVLRAPSVGDFMAQVSSRLRNIQPPEMRAETRREFFGLLRELNVDVGAQPPYDPAAADRLRELLQEAGLGAKLLLDFETILEAAGNDAHRLEDEAKKVAEVLEQERRKKEEWYVIEKDDVDVDEQWEMV